MNSLKYAIKYMELRIKFLEVTLELERFRNHNPSEGEIAIREAKQLLDFLREIVE